MICQRLGRVGAHLAANVQRRNMWCWATWVGVDDARAGVCGMTHCRPLRGGLSSCLCVGSEDGDDVFRPSEGEEEEVEESSEDDVRKWPLLHHIRCTNV